MSFTSLSFLLFFVTLLLLYATLPLACRKPLLVAAGLFFYGYWDWRFLGLMSACIVADYFLALRIYHTESETVKRRYLVASLLFNLGLLGFFKYYNFFIGSANVALAPLGVPLPHLAIILPVGISFFTFESLSYTFDVYRGALVPCRRLIDFALFIAFFPRLVAGPIIRASKFLPQLERPLVLNGSDVQAGALIFLSGLVKKLLLADNLAPFVDHVFAQPLLYDTPTAWWAILAYSLQIYYDFSGYSDMAVGLARVFGFELPINFSAPYGARNLTDFWRRWHMSLSTWLRDYVYISLGGNRKGVVRTYVNLIATMLVGGLWHGASGNFVLWGGLHGAGLAIHKLCGARFPRLSLPAPLAHGLTLLCVALLWVPFRAVDWPTCMAMYHQLAGLGSGVQWLSPWLLPAALACALSAARRQGDAPDFLRFETHTFWGRAQLSLAVLCLAYFTPLNVSPFVYFQF